jgi:hypothetical protein
MQIVRTEEGMSRSLADEFLVMFSVVVLQWITSEKTRPLSLPAHAQYVLRKNSVSRARRSGEDSNGQVLGLTECQVAIQRPCPSAVDSVWEGSKCEGRTKIDYLGALPSILSAEDDISNCENGGNKLEDAVQDQQTVVQEVDA